MTDKQGAEERLQILAAGTDWDAPALDRLRAMLAQARDDIRVRGTDLFAGWDGEASEAARVVASALINDLSSLELEAEDIQKTVSRNNDDRRTHAEKLLAELPGGQLPEPVARALIQGATVTWQAFTNLPITRDTQNELADFLSGQRRQAAEKALRVLEDRIGRNARALVDERKGYSVAIREDFNKGELGSGPGSGTTGYTPDGPGSAQTGGGGGSGGASPSSTGAPRPAPDAPPLVDVGGGPETPGDSSGSAERPRVPGVPTLPGPMTPHPPVAPGPPEGQVPQPDPALNPGIAGGGLSQDSALTGTDGGAAERGLRSGAAGTVGIAAGARLAGGASGGGVLGINPATSTAGAGGEKLPAASSPATSNGGNRAPGAGLLGGQAGGGEAQKKRARSGGYVVPKLEEAPESMPASLAAGAGRRREKDAPGPEL